MSGWLVLLALAIGAIVGYAHGVIAATLALAGLILGGVIGSHLAAVISLGSPGWSLLGGLIGALAGASLLGRIGGRARKRVRIPGVGLADGILGGLLGAALALELLWSLPAGLGALRLTLPHSPAAGNLDRIERALGVHVGGEPRFNGAGPGPPGPRARP